jgi:hypothetical protein
MNTPLVSYLNMENEYILYIPESLSITPFIQALTQSGIRFQSYQSSLHHPNALLLHRLGFSKKILSSEFESNWSKVAILYFPHLLTLSDFDSISSSISTYISNNIKPIILFQGLEDFIASLKVNVKLNSQSSEAATFEEDFEEWQTNLMTQGVDSLHSDSYKQSADIIVRISQALTKSPYKAEASIFRSTSKKLQPNTEVPLESRDFATQLINIPGISETKALRIIQEYPTLPLLLSYYQSPDIPKFEKENRFAGLFSRKENRLSQKLYTIYNSLNPDEIV